VGKFAFLPLLFMREMSRVKDPKVHTFHSSLVTKYLRRCVWDLCEEQQKKAEGKKTENIVEVM
jgi:hypothetical protein